LQTFFSTSPSSPPLQHVLKKVVSCNMNGRLVPLAVRWCELRALPLQGRHSTTWAPPLVLFCLSYFLDRVSSLCLGLALNHSPPSLIPFIWLFLLWVHM
jgi:hypothetical protein